MPSRLTVVLVSLLLAAPIVVFWLWLMIQPKREAVECPEECWCVKGGYFVNCSDADLKNIPSILPRNVRGIMLDNNNVTFLENDSFVSSGLVELLLINADFCQIRKIELGALSGLTTLTHLSLESNEISEIIPGTFEKQSSLEFLNLGNNIIQHLGIDVFSGLVTLQYMGLQGNKLQHLKPDMFIGLPKLQTLLLSENLGLQIPTDSHFITSHSLKHLGISGCNVSSVSVQTFANVSALEWLDLSYNNLRILDINILKVLPELSELNMKSNDINEIIPGTFERISRLEHLQLDYNKIEHLGSDLFYGLLNLKYIDLVGNKLQFLDPDTFVGLPNLQELYLSNNADLQIPTDRHFINSHSLKVLGISGCNINSVSVETFANVSALGVLDLEYNYLSRVDINILKVLPELSAMYLNFNPLQCDCQLQEVWRWCQDHNIQTARKQFAPECVTPSEVKGMWWGVLEKGQCSEDTVQYYGDYKNTSYSYTSIEDTDRETEKEENFLSFVQQYKLPLSAVLFIFGTIGNVIIIIIISCNKDMRTVPNIYIFNLAISDIINLIVLFCTAWQYPVTWTNDFVMCHFIPFCYQMSVSLTAYSITVLSIQRYRLTVDPLQFRVSSQKTWHAIGAAICGVWIVAALSAVPEARSRRYCDEVMIFGITSYYHYVVIFHLLVSCVIPLCVIAFSYIMTACHLVKNSRSISEGTQNHQLNTRKRSAEIVLGLTVIFLISYVPYHIWRPYAYFSFISDTSGAKMRDKLVWVNNLEHTTSFLQIFLLINSCLNPVALLCTSLAFRRQFKRHLTRCCKANSPPTEFELTRRN